MIAKYLKNQHKKPPKKAIAARRRGPSPKAGSGKPAGKAVPARSGAKAAAGRAKPRAPS